DGGRERIAGPELRLVALDGVEQRIGDEWRGQLEQRQAELDELTARGDERAAELEQRLTGVADAQSALGSELGTKIDDGLARVESRVGEAEAIAAKAAAGLERRVEEI